VNATRNTPSVRRVASNTSTPVAAVLNNNEHKDSLTYPSIEASTGQVEIKDVIVLDQEEVKEAATNQTEVKNADQKYVKGDIKDPTYDQKEIKGNVYQKVTNASPAVAKFENKDEVIDLTEANNFNNDDDDFKPLKKKYRAVGVCYLKL